YHELDGMFLKLDILGHDDPLILKKMYELTGVDYAKITPDDDKVMSLFSDTAALGISPEDIGGVSVGTLGISEFGNSCAVKMLEMLRPSAFSQLVKIDGLLHGTDVWEGNAKELIESGTAGLDECIGTRDDVMQYLLEHDFDRDAAFRIMEAVRKGHGLSIVWTSAMEERNIPDWYIKSCNKIGYLFPRAHAVSYTYMAWLTAWYKLYYPEEFYKVYFEVKGKACGEKKDISDAGLVEERIREYEKKEGLSATERNSLAVLYVAREMHARRRCLL
ncbi:MAG: PolC-type DNA polymerase III, partial [Lachnospiraceae bacterium]|nr:PolC-type DNA polymerase III [Lachnospiraceae bacterium]